MDAINKILGNDPEPSKLKNQRNPVDLGSGNTKKDDIKELIKDFTEKIKNFTYDIEEMFKSKDDEQEELRRQLEAITSAVESFKELKQEELPEAEEAEEVQEPGEAEELGEAEEPKEPEESNITDNTKDVDGQKRGGYIYAKKNKKNSLKKKRHGAGKVLRTIKSLRNKK